MPYNFTHVRLVNTYIIHVIISQNKKLATSDCKNKELTDEVSRLKKSQQGNQVMYINISHNS